MQKTLGTALAGLVLGAISVPLAMATFAPLGFFVFAALVALAAVRRESRAFGGGLLMAFGCGGCISFARPSSDATS